MKAAGQSLLLFVSLSYSLLGVCIPASSVSHSAYWPVVVGVAFVGEDLGAAAAVVAAVVLLYECGQWWRRWLSRLLFL